MRSAEAEHGRRSGRASRRTPWPGVEQVDADRRAEPVWEDASAAPDAAGRSRSLRRSTRRRAAQPGSRGPAVAAPWGVGSSGGRRSSLKLWSRASRRSRPTPSLKLWSRSSSGREAEDDAAPTVDETVARTASQSGGRGTCRRARRRAGPDHWFGSFAPANPWAPAAPSTSRRSRRAGVEPAPASSRRRRCRAEDDDPVVELRPRPSAGRPAGARPAGTPPRCPRRTSAATWAPGLACC